MRLVPMCCLLLALVPLRASVAGPEHGRSFKDWTLRCDVPHTGLTKGCYISQDRRLASSMKGELQVAVGYLSKKGKPGALLTLPLGVSLPGGVSLAIDGSPPLRIRYERCESRGCLAPLALKDDVLKLLMAGRQARVAFFDTYRREVSVSVSLLGFTAGFKALK